MELLLMEWEGVGLPSSPILEQIFLLLVGFPPTKLYPIDFLFLHHVQFRQMFEWDGFFWFCLQEDANRKILSFFACGGNAYTLSPLKWYELPNTLSEAFPTLAFDIHAVDSCKSLT